MSELPAISEPTIEYIDEQPVCSLQTAIDFVRKIQEQYPEIKFNLNRSLWIHLNDRTWYSTWTQEIKASLDIPEDVKPVDHPKRDQFIEITIRSDHSPPEFAFARIPIPTIEEYLASISDPHSKRCEELRLEHCRINLASLLNHLNGNIDVKEIMTPETEDLTGIQELQTHLAAFCEQVEIELKTPFRVATTE